uniref:Roadblock/LAMTOR2 domain-containing protein n=1 Tax=Coturnix japonica TaxID=93934 RepID=A0A8C2SUW5_COTJA
MKRSASRLSLDMVQVFPRFLVGLPNLWPFSQPAEVEETLKRIQSQKGVQGIIVVNSEGIPIESTMDNTTTIQYAGLMHSFIMKARSTVRDIDPQNDLTFLQIRSKKNEIMFAPGALPAAGAEQEED